MIFGPEYNVTDLEEKYSILFSWLKLIYQNVYIIIGLMIAVAIINMSSALLVLIVEKTKMIGIRSQMISEGSTPLVHIPEHVTNSIEIAELEFKQKKYPYL